MPADRRPGPTRGRPAGRIAAALFALSFALTLPLAPGARAQGLTLGGPSNKQPVTISADSGIEWQQNAKVYIARGHAVATRGATRVAADTLTAHYRQKKGGSEIYRLDADGHVVITGPRQTITGDHAVYDADQQVAVVTGRNLKLTTPTEVVTARDSLEWYEGKEIAVARGDALAVRDGKRIRADVLTAYMVKDARAPARAAARGAEKPASAELGEGASRISRIDAQGNVIVSTATDVGRGDYGVYDARTGIVTLLGHVTITRGQDVVRGQYAVVDLNRNVSRIMSAPGHSGGRVEGVFVRRQAQPPQTPATGRGRR